MNISFCERKKKKPKGKKPLEMSTYRETSTDKQVSKLVISCHFAFFLSSWAIELPGLCNGQYAVRLLGIKYKNKHVAF